jgi:hypothetical protein
MSTAAASKPDILLCDDRSCEVDEFCDGLRSACIPPLLADDAMLRLLVLSVLVDVWVVL